MPRIRKVRVVSAALPITFLILAGTAYADPVLAESMGLDVWEIGRLEKDLQNCQAYGDRLEAERVSLGELMAVNEAILADVAGGRLALPVAARRKWELNRRRPEVRDHLDRTYTGATYEQKTAADLCVRARSDFRETPIAQALNDRLAAEYAAAYHMPLPLPRAD